MSTIASYFNLYGINFVTKNDYIRLIANCSRNNFLSGRMYTQEMTSLFLSVRHTCRTIPSLGSKRFRAV